MLAEVRNVKKYFGINVKAVDGVSLSIQSGESLGLVGESGSGKTTLGRLILRLYKPDSGFVIVPGQNDVQVVFQDPYNSLDPRFTIQGILSEAFWKQKMTSTSKSEKMKDILKSVGLGQDILNRYPHEFSGGERQRIAIARSLLMNPKLLILDEAVSSLDVLIAAQIIELLKNLQLKYNLTYLFITHNLRVARQLCQRIAVMNSGKIIEAGKTEDIFKHPLHPYTQELLAAALSYQSPKTETVYRFSQNSVLIDKGNGHFVVN